MPLIVWVLRPTMRIPKNWCRMRTWVRLSFAWRVHSGVGHAESGAGSFAGRQALLGQRPAAPSVAWCGAVRHWRNAGSSSGSFQTRHRWVTGCGGVPFLVGSVSVGTASNGLPSTAPMLVESLGEDRGISLMLCDLQELVRHRVLPLETGAGFGGCRARGSAIRMWRLCLELWMWPRLLHRLGDAPPAPRSRWLWAVPSRSAKSTVVSKSLCTMWPQCCPGALFAVRCEVKSDGALSP